MEPPAPMLPGELEGEPDEPERLESGPVLSGRPGVRRVVLVAVAVLAALLIGVMALGEIGGSNAQESAADLSPTPTATASQIDWPTPRPATPTPPRPTVFSSDGFLADLDIDLFVRSNRAVFRIDTRARRVTRTALQLETSGPVSFLAVRDRVLIRPLDPGPGYAVVDGQPIRPLAGYVAVDGEQLPGTQGRVWVIRREGVTSVARLTDTSGRRLYSTVRVPSDGQFIADGSGGLFVTGIGGTYRATNTGLRRVSGGTILATGRSRFLTVECDERFACGSYLYDGRSSTGKRMSAARLPPNSEGLSPDTRYAATPNHDGLLSPDGRYAATLDWRRTDGPHLGVTEVASGRLLTEWQLGDSDGKLPAAWLPDGRLLGLANTRLFVFDPRTRSTIRPSIRLPPLRQIAVRLPAG